MRKRVWICDVLGPYVCVGLVWERKGCAADARVGRAGVLCVRAAVAGSEPVRECLCSGCRGRAGAVAARGRLCGVLDVNRVLDVDVPAWTSRCTVSISTP